MTDDSWKVREAAKPPRRKKEKSRRRRAVITALLTGMALTAGLAFAWTISVNPANDATAYGKSGNLPTVTLSTVDVSATLVGDVMPDLTSAGCPSACGSVSLKFVNPTPYTVTVTSVTFGNGFYGPGGCLTEIFTHTQSVNISVPPSGQSAKVTIPNILHMSGAAPDSCAATVFPIPITALVGTAT